LPLLRSNINPSIPRRAVRAEKHGRLFSSPFHASNINAETLYAILAERNPQVAQVVVRLRELAADERARDLYERREKARRVQ
jgi:hypothetical protein